MDEESIKVIILVLISALAYALPMVWIKGSTHTTACISSLFSLITLAVYTLFIKGHSFGELDGDRLKKLIITGVMYGLGTVLYIEATKYNKISLLNLQTILIFLVSTLMAFMVLGEESNRKKIIGIIAIIVGIFIFIKGDE